MSEDQELQARITALSGRINLHKQGAYAERGGRGRGYSRGSSNWYPQRGTPYGYQRPRGGRTAAPTHRNRTLVLNTQSDGQSPSTSNGGLSSASTETPQTSAMTATPTFVSKRDRHMQLINTSVYDKLSSERAQDMQKTAAQQQQRRNMRERVRLSSHFSKLAQSHDPSIDNEDRNQHMIDLNNVRFKVTDGGSKLIRVSDDPNTAKVTPKRAKIGGVTFLRSKNGNLYRAGLVGSKKITTVKKVSEPCEKFTATGSCPKGPQCRFIHDPSKVAICKDFLHKGSCPADDACDLSHEPTPERVPACVHFLRGNCTNDSCRYAHVRVNPGAPVCRAFATLGYCEKGSTCAEKHVVECPDYANKGTCRNPKCRLPHVDRAGQIRKVAAAQAASARGDEDESSDLTSDEDEYAEIDSEDVDSEGLEEDMLIPDASGHQLSQQDDFVQF